MFTALGCQVNLCFLYSTVNAVEQCLAKLRTGKASDPLPGHFTGGTANHKNTTFLRRAAASSCEAASYASSVISISSCLSAFLSDNPFAISKFLHLSSAVSLLLALLRNHLVSLYAIFSKRKRCFGTLVSDSEASFYRFALPEDFPYIRSDLKF